MKTRNGRAIRRPRRPIHSSYYEETFRNQRELSFKLNKLIPFVWLPVSRRLPISEESDDFDFEQRVFLDSVDERLNELLEELTKYRFSLDTKLSERYKAFVKDVLQMILYNKKFDTLKGVTIEIPTDEDKEQIIRAFEAAGLLDSQMGRRIDEHFEVSNEAISRLKKITDIRKEVDWQDFLVIPLITRTKSIVDSARSLEQERESLFAPILSYEAVVNSFFSDKQTHVSDSGKLKIYSKILKHEINHRVLSSGEKQILILLTQALLKEDRPVVYVADEPELSLHVVWQEKLLKSLLKLGNQIQIIVATHSPDIVGPFHNNVIDLTGKK